MIILRVREGWVMVTKNRRKNGIKRKQEGQGRYNYRGGYGRACAKGSNWLQKGLAQCGSLDQNGQSRRTLTDVKAPPTNHSASIQIWPAGRSLQRSAPAAWLILQNSPQHGLRAEFSYASNRRAQVHIQVFWIATLDEGEWSCYRLGCYISVEFIKEDTRQGDVVLWRQ